MLYRVWFLFCYAKGIDFVLAKAVELFSCKLCTVILQPVLGIAWICSVQALAAGIFVCPMDTRSGVSQGLRLHAQNLRCPFSGFLLPGSLHYFLVALAARALYPQFLWPRQQLPITTTAIETVMFYFRVKPQKLW